MKIIDTRDQRVLEGELVATIPAGQAVSEEDMRRFYAMGPHHRNYNLMSAPQTVERIVLQRGDVEDHSFYIIPRYPFYKEAA